MTWRIKRQSVWNNFHVQETELWVWVTADKDEQLFQGCVCHTPGPFDPFFRQPRLARYCTRRGCTQQATLAMFFLGKDRPYEYACDKHVDELHEFWPDEMIWYDVRKGFQEEPTWTPVVNAA